MSDASSAQMILGLVIGIGALIFLCMKTKIHTFLALLFAAMITGLIGGMDANAVIQSVTTGFGTTLGGNTGIVIGLGIMMGVILEKSGAAERLAFSTIKTIGKRNEEWALGLTGFLVAIPVFADSGQIILAPLAKAVSRVSGKSVVGLGLSLSMGLALTHIFVPPGPGPLAVAGLLNVDVGMMIIFGIAFTILPFILCMLYCKWVGKKIYQIPTEDGTNFIKKEYKQEYIKELNNIEEIMKDKNFPTLTMSLLPIVVPLLLIFLKTILDLTVYQYQIIDFLGSPIVAVSIGVLISIYGLVGSEDKETVIGYMNEGIKSVGMILLVTGAGGSIGYVVSDSGIGEALGGLIVSWPIPPVIIPFIIAAIMRIALGSATVALTTTATLTAPLLTTVGLHPMMAAMATCAGGISFSYFNDSGFWVFNSLFGITEIKDQMYAKFNAHMIAAVSALILVLIVDGIFY